MTSVARLVAAGVIAALALAGSEAIARPDIPVFVVVRDYAAVPPDVLRRATQLVTDVYRPLGIGIVWVDQDAGALRAGTMRLTMLRRTAGREDGGRIIGIDAAEHLEPRMHVAHILFQDIGDTGVTAKVLACVMARLIGGALQSSGATGSATIIRAGRDAAEHLGQGAALFTLEEVKRIQDGALALAR
ncbi:MAG: hypothetical protein HYY76_18695 [Acidobacteria bacterium]|nr:hypothetical protein [Acidobacteriota bacterium]